MNKKQLLNNLVIAVVSVFAKALIQALRKRLA